MAELADKMSESTFSIVTEKALSLAVVRAMGETVRSAASGGFELARSPGRHALPAASRSHFGPADETRIAESFQIEHHCLLYAVPLEPCPDQWPVYSMPATAEGLQGFQRACAHFNYALCTPDALSLVLCSTDDFLVYAGTRTFVERCVGADEASAFNAFFEYAADPSWVNQKLSRNLKSVYSTLAEEYPNSPYGSFVKFPK